MRLLNNSGSNFISCIAWTSREGKLLKLGEFFLDLKKNNFQLEPGDLTLWRDGITFLQGVALTKVPKIKFLIIVGGAKFRNQSVAEKAYASPIQCTSVHFLGRCR